MAELTIFGYRSGRTLLHQLDVRLKIVFLIFCSLVSIKISLFALSTLSFVLAVAILHCRLALTSIFKEIRYFLVLLGIICLARTLSADDSNGFEFYFLKISLRGFYQGALISWRLLIIVLLGLLFVSTTRSSEIKSAVEWFLHPIPRVPGQKVATMLSLVMRFVPLIFNQARETAEAQKARAIERRKNPIYRLKMLGIPLLRRTFENADNLIVAMEARCYSEKRTTPGRSAGFKDGIVLFLMCIFFIVLVML